MNSTKNILLISPLPPPAGGIATWTKRLVENGLPSNFELKLVDTKVIGNRKVFTEKISWFQESKRSLKIFYNLIYNLLFSKVSIVHLNTSCAKFGLIRDFICVLIIKLFKKPVVIHCRCNVNDLIPKYKKIYKKIFIEILNNSSEVLVQNQPSFLYVKDNCYKNPIIFPNFINDNLLFASRTKKEISATISSILFVGAVSLQKGIKEIVEAAKVFPHIEFRIIGDISISFDDLGNYSNNVHFLGELKYEEVISEMNNTDLFLFPSYSEGFPNVILEAMAFGLPIIATNVGAIPDMISNKGGIIIDKENTIEIIESIKKLEKNLMLRKSMSKYNRRKVEENYLYSKVSLKLTEIYDNTLSDYNTQ